MSAAKHTPGPWRWMRDDTLVGDRGHRPIVLTATSDHSLRQRDAKGLLVKFDPGSPDGRLMEAAPELLEALEFIVNATPEPGENAELTVEGYNRACAAIAKATRGAS